MPEITLAAEVKRLRALKGLSQQALATAVGISQGAVGHIETGRNLGFDLPTLYRLCDALGVTCDHFRPFIDPPEPVAPPRPQARGKRK